MTLKASIPPFSSFPMIEFPSRQDSHVRLVLEDLIHETDIALERFYKDERCDCNTETFTMMRKLTKNLIYMTYFMEPKDEKGRKEFCYKSEYEHGVIDQYKKFMSFLEKTYKPIE